MINILNYPNDMIEYLKQCDITNILLTISIHRVNVPSNFDNVVLPELEEYLRKGLWKK